MANKYAERGREFYRRYYRQLEGATIIQFVGMNEDEYSSGDGFPCFKVKLRNNNYALIEISKDPEGNGGGFIFGLSAPDMKEYDASHGIVSLREEVRA